MQQSIQTKHQYQIGQSPKKEFILDYDCVCTSINSPEDIKQNLIKMNKLIFDKFNYSITQKFEEYMK